MFRIFLRNVFANKNSLNEICKTVRSKKNLMCSQFIRGLKFNPIETTNKITAGHKMTQVIEKHRLKYLKNKLENEKYKLGKSRLLIACSNPNFNHYTGQVYRNFSEQNLASFGWRNRRSSGQYFTINAITSHPSLIDTNKIRNDNDEMIEFNDLNLNQNLINLVKQNLDIQQPTLIQYLSINQILKRESHNLVIAETGGGKTLAYVLPAIECSITVKKILNEMKLGHNLNQPVCLILVPTRELAFQVYSLIEKLIKFENSELNTEEDKIYLNYLKNLNVVIDLHKAQILAKEQVTGQKLNSLSENLKKPMDILITLPGQLEDRLRDNFLSAAFLRQIVLDEADTLLDDSFNGTVIKCLGGLKTSFEIPETKELFNRIEEEIDYEDEIVKKAKEKFESNLEFENKLKDPSAQLLFVSATIPRDMKNILENLIDCDKELKSINTNKINRLMLHVPQKFIRTNGTKRPEQLLEIIKKDLSKQSIQRTIMVFTQKTKTAIYVHKFLKENNIDCELLTNKLNNKQREEVVNKFFSRKVKVLVCTDIASRGWDTLHVNHVINFEMPHFIADYLHRVGRVGRLNGHKHGGIGGLVTNFIINRFDVDLVWNIEKSLRLGTELHNVNANIKRLYKYSFLNQTDKLPDEKDQDVGFKFDKKKIDFIKKENNREENESSQEKNSFMELSYSQSETNEINEDVNLPVKSRSRRRRPSV